MLLLSIRSVLLGLLLALAVLPHLLIKALTGRSPMVRWFLAGAAWILGLRVRRVGPAPPPRSLLLVNHPSWLDIPAVIAATGCAFVSKVEVRDHWLIGWLADQGETLYIKREDRRDLARQIEAVRERFDHYKPLALAPEGTTSDGTKLRPFRPPLLTAVAPPPEGAQVIPVAVDYGRDRAFVSWTTGESGMDNAKRILGRWRPIEVAVRMLEPLDPALDRKAMARAAQGAIHDALEASSRAAKSL